MLSLHVVVGRASAEHLTGEREEKERQHRDGEPVLEEEAPDAASPLQCGRSGHGLERRRSRGALRLLRPGLAPCTTDLPSRALLDPGRHRIPQRVNWN